MNFPKLRVLDLNENNISDIKVLEKVNFKNLEKLYLSNNYDLADINILEDVNFRELKELDLSWNNISDIKVFEKVKFEKLELLDLFGNNIDMNNNEGIINNLKSRLKLNI